MQLDDQNFCFIGKKSKIIGDLILDGPTHISSTIEGNLEVHPDHKLSIEPAGLVTGKIKAGDIDVYGQVEGDINASGTLRIFPCANVSGKISAKNLIIKPGAIVNMTGHTSSKDN